MSDDMEIFDLADVFSSNKESEENGVWITLTGTTKFKIRSFGSTAANELREKLQKPFQTMLRAGLEIPKKKNEEIGLRILAEAILIGWEGVKVGEWSPDYTVDNALDLFGKLPKIANWIASVSMESQNFRDEQRADGAKN